jgi:hypothetical protein
MSGDITAGNNSLPTTPSSLFPLPVHLTPSSPGPAMVAPMRPPNRACDELDGRPRSQVSRFQTMAPTSPASTMRSRSVPPSFSSSALGVPLAFWILTTALVTVSATWTLRKAPTRLRMADRATATFGRNAPVAMEGGHRVGSVVEPVREVETKSRDDHESQHHECVCHTAIVALRRPVSKT